MRVEWRVHKSAEVRPFPVPGGFVMATGNSGEFPPLSAATPEQLSAMCDEWRAAVFKAAGHVDPVAVERGES